MENRAILTLRLPALKAWTAAVSDGEELYQKRSAPGKELEQKWNAPTAMLEAKLLLGLRDLQTPP